MKNLFRRPLVLGVPFSGLLALSFVVLTLMIALGSSKSSNAISLGTALFGYVSLRLCTRFMVEGWEDELFYPIERKFRKVGQHPRVTTKVSDIEIMSPDTLENSDLIFEKEKLSSRLWSLKENSNLVFEFSGTDQGVLSKEVLANGFACKDTNLSDLFPDLVHYTHVYSLKTLPISTHPLLMFEILSRIKQPYKVLIRIVGLGFLNAKRKVESSRRRNSKDSSAIRNIDSDVTFEESSKVLEAMSRGEETIAEFSMVVLTERVEEELDPSLFHLEKNRELTLLSVLGVRKKQFRSHILRLVTVSDLIPTFLDPSENAASVLRTVRDNPLYFSPQDSRLEALHWLVVGATGTGKSFFTGAVLKRLIEQNTPMSVIFVDHNRSFRRLVRSTGGSYLEPQTLNDIKLDFDVISSSLNSIGAITGVELSDLHFDEKKSAAHYLLSQMEQFLRNRNTTHPIYLVLDECWNFLRDEPILVQRAFREFRKLNGAVVAITQSLSDFLSDASGKSIVQNAPIRILLRQGEDPSPYKGVLGLNDIEVQKLRLLKQQKGSFSECLIKTSFLSRIGRLYPNQQEYQILRTDNLREEMILEAKKIQMEVGRA